MHRAPRITERLIRVSASDGKQTWVYQFPHILWRKTVKRIMQDMRESKLPEDAAAGILELIAEEVAGDAD